MAFNGAGAYSLPTGNPAVTGTTISSTTHNNTMSDIATALSNVICKDGQTTVTADIPMASYKFTGLAAGSASGHSVRYEQVVLNTGTQSIAGVKTFSDGLVSTVGLAVGGATAGAGGVAFPATAVAVADVNTLDDYEEGTFTPVLTTTGTGFTSGGATGSGIYRKVGGYVHVRGHCTLSGAVSAGTGNVTITGLPFTSGAVGIGSLYIIRVTLTGTLGISIAVANGSAACTIEQNVSASPTTSLPASAVNGNSDPAIYFSLSYPV